jgi:hypothetical protein
MGIFDTPKNLAKLLSSVNVSGEQRPLSPIDTAKWLKQGVDELGSSQEVMNRVSLGNSMWQNFMRLLNIHEDIENSIKWGQSNPETLAIGFSAAHVIALFEPKQQLELVNVIWDYERPIIHDELRRIKAYLKSNPTKSLTEAIENILKIDRVEKTIISIFISSIDSNIYEKLEKKSRDDDVSINELTKQILQKLLPENSITNVKIKKTLIRIVFSEQGKQEFNKIAKKYQNRNTLINSLLIEVGNL